MAIKEQVKRPEPGSGFGFNTFRDPSGGRSQGVAITDEDGSHQGIEANPLVIKPWPAPVIRYNTGALPEASAILSAVPTRLLHLRVVMDLASVAPAYMLLFDAVSVPANNAVPIWRTYVHRDGQADETFEEGKELVFTYGLVVALSSTPGTLTLADPLGYFHARRI